MSVLQRVTGRWWGAAAASAAGGHGGAGLLEGAPVQAAPVPAEKPASSNRRRLKRVTTCYSVIDRFFPLCGMLDMTEGIYHGDDRLSYEAAQRNQLNWLLDQVDCRPGSRLMEIGCGYGTLLEQMRERGVRGIGVTISPEQARRGQARGLDARLLNYRELDRELDGKFDAVIANGPIEHFVQPQEALEGRADAIYRELFATAHRLIDPQSTVRRLVTTTIHFVRTPDPADLLRSPLAFRRDSDSFHYSLLARSFSGWYPELGQFERCARGYFTLAKTVDGTDDYRRTSEHWLERVRSVVKGRRGLRILASSLPLLARHPWQFATMLWCMLGTESWNWQFRGPDPPTRLLRQTWQYAPAP